MEKKVKAYGGLLVVSKKQYLSMQAAVFGVLAIVFVASFFYDFNNLFFGNSRLVIGVIAVLEVIEMVYVLRKFSKEMI